MPLEPTDAALGLDLACDFTCIAKDTDRVHLVAEIRAHAPGVERERPPLTTVFVLDVSGSMAGPPLEHVARSVDKLVDLLEPTDRVGVVSFSDDASEVAPVAPVEVTHKQLVRSRTKRMRADGRTNIEAGVKLAKAILPARSLHERQVLLVLSDGQPNVGASDGASLGEVARALRPDVSVSTLGYGARHDEDVLAAIANGGGGRYHFVADPAMCALQFAQVLGAQGDVVAEGVELVIMPAAGVEVVRLVGEIGRPRFGADGMVVPLPDMLDGGRVLVVAEVRIAPEDRTAERFSRELARARLVWRRAGSPAKEEREASLSAPLAHGDLPAERVPAVYARVLLARTDEVRAEARALADRHQFAGAATKLRALMAEMKQAPGFVAGDGSPLAEAYEVLLDDAVAMERVPSPEAYANYRKTSMGTSMMAGTGYGPAASVRGGALSRMFVSGTVGKYPKAKLVVVVGPNAGARFDLAAQNTIGRTTAADIAIASESVSRRHADVFVADGRFFVADLGSTNTTEKNGKRIVDVPEPLSPGDVIKIGDVVLKYLEDV